MPLQLSIVTPERAVLELEVESVVVPGAEGEFGVLPDHESLLAPVAEGLVRYTGSGGSGEVSVTDGFAEVTGGRVTLLVGSADSA